MKFLTLAALFGVITANNLEVKKDQIFLRDEMKSLLNLVQTVETGEADAVLDLVEARKEKLKIVMTDKPERTEAISNEFRNLLALVEAIEADDKEGAMDELRARKEELLGIHEFLLAQIEEGDDEPLNLEDEEEVTSPEGTAETNKELWEKFKTAKTAFETAKAADKTAQAAALAGKAEGTTTTKDEQKALDDAAALTKTERATAYSAWKDAGGKIANKNMGVIIFACLAGAACVGTLIWYTKCRKPSPIEEGGDAEARAIFKAQIKKNKPQKENLV